jgi:hypothetical protein
VTDVAAALGRTVATASLAVGAVGKRLPEDAAAARQVERLVESLVEFLDIKVKA